MATYYFKGTCKWAKVYEPDEDYDKKSKSWKIDLFMDDESFSLFEESGAQLKVREDKETKAKYVTFKRPTRKLIRDEIVEYASPTVVDSSNTETDIPIGNGSTVTCKVEIYNTAKGKGHTLEAVRIEELVEYSAKEVKSPADVVPF